jgi:DNA-3-methyladenine glycosylase
MNISIKRVYLPAEDSDGYRVLVDRLWPRGIKKENAKIDLWAKALAPSAELRKWFNHIPERFEEFSKKYVEELKGNPEVAPILGELRQHDKVTLLYGAKDEQHNNAVVLLHLLSV